MDNLFTGVGSSYAFRTYKDLSSTDPESTAQKIVFRLPKGEKPAASFDLLNNYEGVKDFRLEGSTDGEEWTVLTTVTGIKNGSYWASSGAAKGADETAATHVVDTTAHPLFKLPTHAPVKSYAMLSNVTSVSVSRGATLKAKGDVMLPRLTVDCSAGGGTVDGFKFAPSGKIVLTNAPRATEEIPLVFTNCSGLENVAGWAVEASRGTMTVRRTVECRNGKLYAVAPGLTVIVR